jgi:hypothetical protein
VGGERAELLEGSVVEQQGEPLARGQLAAGMLLFDALTPPPSTARLRISRRVCRWSFVFPSIDSLRSYPGQR